MAEGGECGRLQSAKISPRNFELVCFSEADIGYAVFAFRIQGVSKWSVAGTAARERQAYNVISSFFRGT